MVNIIYSPEFLKHRTGRYHPESPQRLTAIYDRLQENGQLTPHLQWLEPKPVEESDALAWVERIHTPELIDQIRTIAKRGGGKLDADTAVSSNSYHIALLAVSAWLDAIDRTCETKEPTFILARPPGHHATHSIGMGFCLFSNAGIAAHYAIQEQNIDKVAILDWDVHHGNGTEDVVAGNEQIRYCSLHQHPCYPGTGNTSFNNVLNIPLSAGSNIDVYQKSFQNQVMPFLQSWQPDLLIVSAGYDANQDDPLASMALLPQDYGVLTHYAFKICDRVVFGLEGGYDLPALARSVEATLLECLESVE